MMITATYKGRYHNVDYSIVNVSELEGELRIDAEYYDPFYLKNEKRIKERKWEYLINEERKITDGSHEVRQYVEKGILFLRVQDIFENYIEVQENVYISKEENEKLRRSEPRKCKDVLITKTGKIGVATVFHLEEKANVPADIAILKNDSSLNSYYISTFLNTFYGKIILQRQMSGLGRPRLVLESFKYIKIPIPSDTFQKQIEKMVLKAYEEKQKSERLYKQAEEILLEELGLRNWEPKTKKIKIGGKKFEEEENISIRMSSEVIKADRMDAEYWEIKYNEIENIIKNTGCYTYIYNIEKFNQRGIQPKYLDGVIKVITSKDLGKHHINYENLQTTTEEFYNENLQAAVYENDILIYTTGANIGTTNVFLEKFKALASNHVNILRVGEINPIYLSVYLNSFVGRSLTQKFASGSAQRELYPEHIRNFIVFKSSKQSLIADKVKQSFKARQNSKKILEIAKKAVEIYIEKSEKEGLKYIKGHLTFDLHN